MTLRRRLENSRLLERITSALISGYIRFCAGTTRWQRQGLQELRAALADGPVIVLFWHSRVMLAPRHWPLDLGRLAVLRDSSTAGRLSAAVQRRMGLEPVEMSHRASNLAASRAVLKKLADGVSLALTADGPDGPALRVKDAPLEWLRVTKQPVFIYAHSVRRQRRLSSWDRMLWPLPFTRGAMVFRRWPDQLPRRATATELQQARGVLQQLLTAVQSEADALVGLQPGP